MKNDNFYYLQPSQEAHWYSFILTDQYKVNLWSKFPKEEKLKFFETSAWSNNIPNTK